MRGVGDLEQFVDPKHFPSGGIIIDDVDMGGVANAGLLFDVNQVEFLRGPQGTRFGTSALAGSVQVRSHDPTDQFEGVVSGGYGNYDSWNLGVVASGPLADTLLGRIAVQRNESDGFIDNRYLGRDDTNGLEETMVRGKLKWLASDRASVDVMGFYIDTANGYDAFTLDNTRNTLSDAPGHDDQETAGFAGKGYFELNDRMALEAVLTWTDAELDYGFDEDWTYVGICDGTLCDPIFDFFSNTDNYQRDRDTVSLDVRLTAQEFNDQGLRFVAGVFGQQRDESLHREYYGDFSSDYETERYAIYGQIEFAPFEALQFTAGLRYEDFSDDYSDTNGLDLDSSDGLWSGELTAEWFLDSGSLLYATLSRGAKPGGVNTEASSSFPFLQPALQDFVGNKLTFDSETLLNKEVGFKGTFFGDSLWVRAALFHMDRENAQLESWIWDGVGFLWVGLLDSSSDGENYGVELEAVYALNERLELFGTLGLLETEVDELTVFDLDANDFVSRSNRDQAKAPQYQFSIGANVRLTSQLSGRVEVEGRDDSYFGYYHNGEIDGYEIVNASLVYQRGPLEIQAWGRNLLDEDYAVHGLYFGNDPRKGWVNETYYQYGEPRVYGVNVRYHF
jgi:outer membrane receptor protein involved in Fe transport